MSLQATFVIPDSDFDKYQSEDFNRSWDEAQAPFDQADAFGKDWKNTEKSLTLPSEEGQPPIPTAAPTATPPSRADEWPGSPAPPAKDVIFGDKYDPSLAPTGEQDPTFWEKAREKLSDPNNPLLLPGPQRLAAAVTSGKGIPETPEEALKRAEDVIQSTNTVTPFGIYNPQIAQGLASGVPGIEGGGLEGLAETATEKMGIHPTNVYDKALQKALGEVPPELRASLEAANRTAAGGGKFDIRSIGSLVERALADRMAPANAVGPGSEAELSALLGRRGAAFDKTLGEFGPVYAAVGDDYPYLNQLAGLQKYIDASIAKENPERFSAFAKSLGDAQAQVAAIEAHLGPNRWSNLLDANNLRQAAQDKLLQDTVDAGLIPQKLADQLRQDYPNFSPTVVQRFFDQEDAAGIRGAGNNLTQRWNTLKKLTEEGSADDQLPPMQATFKAAIERYIAIQKNHAMQTLADEGGFKVSPVRQGQQPTGLVFRQGGKLVQMEVPRDVKVAVENLNSEQLNGMSRVFSALNKPLRMGATQLNPTFLAANAMADFFQALLREGTTPGEVVRGYEAALNKSALYHTMVRSGGGFGAEGSWFTGRAENLGKDLARMEKDIVNSGGVVVGKGDFQNLLRAIEQKDVGALAKYFGSLGPIQTVGAAIEQGPRLATFAKHLDVEFEKAMGRKSASWDELAAWGESQPPEITAPAAMAARRVTVDFSRIGQYMRSMNAMVPFLNAQIQGGLTVGRTLRDIPQSRARLAALVTVSGSISLWNQAIFPDEYADVPSYIKQGSLVLMMPGSVKNDNGLGYKKLNYIALPVRSWGAFTTAIDEAVQAVKTRDPDLLRRLSNVANATNPIPGDPFGASVPQGSVNWGDPLNLLENVGYSAGNLMPAPFKAPIELAVNRDFYRHAPISPQAEADTNKYTPELQQKQNTSLVAKVLGEKIGASPIAVDYLINGWFAGGGTTAAQGASTLMGQESDRPPMVGGLLRTIYRDYGGAITQKAYDDRDAAFHQIAQENHQLFASFKKGDVPLGDPPTKVEGISLLPAEQATYQKAKIDFLAQIIPTLNDVLGGLDKESRKEVLQELQTASNEQAAAETLKALPADELVKRLLYTLGTPINPSHRAVEEQWSPVPAQ